MPRTLPLAAAAVAATFAFVLAGCGGGASPEEKWADNVCTDLSNWQGQLNQVTNDVSSQLQSPGAGTLAAINADIHKALNATNQLVHNLRAIGAPNVEAGAQAKQQVDALATQLQETATKAKQTLASVPKGASLADTVQKLAALAPQIQAVATSASSTLKAVEARGSALKEGIEKADSCDQFR
jgi:hypothetical protein